MPPAGATLSRLTVEDVMLLEDDLVKGLALAAVGVAWFKRDTAKEVEKCQTSEH